MLLRSSSTPIIGSLLSSLAETPNRDFDTSNNNNKPPSSNTDHHHTKISFLHGGQSNFSSFSCNSSPFTGVSDSDREPNTKSLGGFRRALSDGNLEGLVAASDMDELHGYKPPLRSSRKSHHSTLQTIPSFSIYNSTNGYGEEEGEEEEEEEKEEGWGGELSLKNGFLKRSITIGDNINGVGSGEFSFGKSMDLIKEEEDMMMNEIQGFSINDEEGQPKSPPMYLAMGLGLDIGFGKAEDGGDYSLLEYQDDRHRNKCDVEEYYKRMVVDDPRNPLLLRNYAQFLYQSKGDIRGAEEYYSRAILSDPGPGDGDVLSKYAKVVWELHRDRERASTYFERAVEVAPQDSHVHAAYASFLWEMEEQEDCSVPQDLGFSVFRTRAMTSASA